MDDSLAERLFGATAPVNNPAPVTASDSLAERLFGTATRDNPQTGNTAQPASTELAQSLFPEKPKPPELAKVSEEVQAIRQAPERKMFDAQTELATAIPDNMFETQDVDPNKASIALREMREVAADLGLHANEVTAIRDRAHVLQVQPVEPIEQAIKAEEALVSRFGSDAVQALADARLLLQRDQRAAKAIEIMGLGNDAATIVMLAEKARSQIGSGKLSRRK